MSTTGSIIPHAASREEISATVAKLIEPTIHAYPKFSAASKIFDYPFSCTFYSPAHLLAYHHDDVSGPFLIKNIFQHNPVS